MPKQSETARGFSLLELTLVAGIALVLAAVAIPVVHQGLQTYRLSSAATDVANIIQRTRYEAIRKNTIVNCRYIQQGNNWVMWIDLNNDSKMDPTEPQILLPPDAQILPAGVAPGPGSMGYTNTQIPGGSIAFDSRGTVNYGAAAPTVYVIYLGSQQLAGTNGYKAITLTPTGRTKVWSASSGGTWYTN